MAAFEYIALDPRGREQKGLIEADSARQARQLLREKQWSPLDVKQAKAKEDTGGGGFAFGRGLSARDLGLVTRQLATLVQAALPIEEALRAAAAQSSSQKIKSMLLAVRARVMEGHSLAGSLREYPSAFPELYRATVAAGEHAGHLGLVLDQLADYTDQRQQSRQKIQLALLYPVILLVASLAIVVLLLGYVVPDVVKVFVNTGQALPALTTGLIAVSEVVQNWGWLMLIGIVAAALAMRQALRDEKIKRRWHAFILRIPLVGRLARATNTARFASTLAILTRSGVPLVDALDSVAGATGNVVFRNATMKVKSDVSSGMQLNFSMRTTGVFPSMAIQMTAIGEESGSLDEMLDKVAGFYEDEVDNMVDNLTTLMEPMIMAVLGTLVGGLIIAMYLPIFQMAAAMG
ncbi:MAG TPA: type II secretion system protein GspF [Pseudomonas sp.]|nr:type II secretion system protein GspF [Pseudomonas sp.]